MVVVLVLVVAVVVGDGGGGRRVGRISSRGGAAVTSFEPLIPIIYLKQPAHIEQTSFGTDISTRLSLCSDSSVAITGKS